MHQSENNLPSSIVEEIMYIHNYYFTQKPASNMQDRDKTNNFHFPGYLLKVRIFYNNVSAT